MNDAKRRETLSAIRHKLELVSRIPNGPTVERPWVEPNDWSRYRRRSPDGPSPAPAPSESTAPRSAAR